MWYLVCHSKDGQSYRLTKDKNHNVSRTIGDIVLTGDQSVSRKHAVFKVNTSNNNSRGENSGVTITDLGSKYGTSINGTLKLEPQKPHWLQDGDVITFGCQWNEWCFHSKPLVVTTSTLPTEDKGKIKEVISELGGTVVSDWQDSCTHLIMAEILLTAKVVCALASAMPIVSPNYWTCFKEALDQHKLPPDPEKFIPPLRESILNRNKVSFAVNRARQKIFHGKTFVFCFDRQLKKYKNIIVAAGGSCKTIADYDQKLDEFCKPDVILMQNISTLDSPLSQPSQLYNSALRFVRSKGLKPIPESDIGLAILMCSMDMYCNPQYNVIENVLEGVLSSSQLKGGEILAAETPHFGSEISTIKIENVEVNEPVSPVLSIMESGTLRSTGDSSSMYDSRNLDKTLPCGLGDKNSLEEQAISSPPTAPTRKRAAPMEVDEPTAKKGLPQSKISSETVKRTEPLFEKFDFVDLFAPKTPSQTHSQPPNRTDQKKHDEPWYNCANETSKRKVVEGGNSPSSGNLSKKQCLEGRSVEGVPRSIHQTPGTSENRVPPVFELEEDLNALKVDVPLSSGGRPHNNGSSALEGSSSSKGEPSNLEEETDGISRNCVKNAMEGGLFAPRSKGGSRESGETFDEPHPSTSKSVKCAAKDWGIGEIPKDEVPIFGRRVIVRKESLVVERPSHQVSESPRANAPVVNYKKFRKVRSVGCRAAALPVIIGDSDLAVFKENLFLE